MSSTFLDEGVLAKAEAEAAKPALKEPRRFKVFLVNDDYTPMEFVVEVLQKFFQKDEAAATQIMWQVHSQGRGVCGVYTRDIAETKVAQVRHFAESSEHPLLCLMEPEQP